MRRRARLPPSTSISLHLFPRASRHPASLSRSLSSTVSLSARRIQFLPRRMAHHSRSTRVCRGGICASILCDARAPATPDNPRPPAFNITRSRAVFVPLSDTRVSAEPRMKRPYRSFPIDRTCCGNYRNDTEIRRQRPPLAMEVRTLMSMRGIPSGQPMADVNDRRVTLRIGGNLLV